MPVYALIVANNGPQLKPSAPGVGERASVYVNGRNYELTFRKRTWKASDAIMHSFPDRPVIDETGLTGTYGLAPGLYSSDALQSGQSRRKATSVSLQPFRSSLG
jgi:uncharacterized protein (TIGR03435 family)